MLCAVWMLTDGGVQGSDSAMTHVHFKAEGDVEFRSILYIPGSAPPNFMENYYSNKAGLKLYVRRVFISDDFEELIPRCRPLAAPGQLESKMRQKNPCQMLACDAPATGRMPPCSALACLGTQLPFLGHCLPAASLSMAKHHPVLLAPQACSSSWCTACTDTGVPEPCKTPCHLDRTATFRSKGQPDVGCSVFCVEGLKLPRYLILLPANADALRWLACVPVVRIWCGPGT